MQKVRHQLPLRESFKEHYLLEGARRGELAGALAVPTAVLSAVLGALAVLCKELHAPLNTLEIIELVFVTLAAVACSFCTYSLFRALYGLAYAFVPTPLELDNYKHELIAYYDSVGFSAAKAEKVADEDAITYLYSEYAKNADRNSVNNNIKSAHIHNANGTLIAAVVLTALAGTVFLFVSITSPSTITKVQIMNVPDAILGSKAEVRIDAQSPPPAPPSPPPRPVPPPSKIIRENTPPPPPPVPARK